MKGASAAGGIRKERSSNLELLRLLAMFCIVANHLVGQGDVLRDASGVNFLFSFFVGNAARISVNVFLIIGCWFMADASFRGSRFVKLWLEELFYTVILTLLMVCFYPADVKPNYVIAAFFPVFGYNHWFISGYLVLILLSPFLKKILEMRPERLKKLVLL
jgi:surface polysaccharide O-acyltransferase-like enzyme